MQFQQEQQIWQTVKHLNTFGNCPCWRPPLTQDIQGYPSVPVNVRMVDSSGEMNAWSMKWVIRGDVNHQKEHTP